VSAVHKRRLKDDNDEDDAENEEPSTAKNLSKINKAGRVSIGFSKKMKRNLQRNGVQKKKVFKKTNSYLYNIPTGFPNFKVIL